MTKEMIKFESIDQFRNTIRGVRDYMLRKHGKRDENGELLREGQIKVPLPTLEFIGTVKLHGTNSSWNYNVKTDEVVCQSRNRVLTLESDNAGFAIWSHSNMDTIKEAFKALYAAMEGSLVSDLITNLITNIVVYGEWAGPGIQKGVAISEIDRKSFFIFDIAIIYENGDEEHFNHSMGFEDVITHIEDVYFMTYYKTWVIEIDFENPEKVQNDLIKITEEVENCCPVGNAFGVEGVGEGVVWTHYLPDGDTLRFKVKGEKHSVSKVKTLAAVDIEKINKVADFVDSVLTDARLEQGIQYLKEMGHPIDAKSTGHFVKWVASDVFKEEADTIVGNNLDSKMVGKQVSNEARKWFFEKGMMM